MSRSTTLLLVLSCTLPPMAVGASISSRSDEDRSPRSFRQSGTSGIAQCPDAVESRLPLPSSLAPDDFHTRLLTFLQNGDYVKLHWCVDKGVRDTGPYVYDEYLGTHPAVHVYYSPAIMTWLVNGRLDAVPDGAMIVKEMYFPGPAARYEGKTLTPMSWTVMIKDSNESKDGWFWGGLFTSKPGDPPMPSPGDSYKPPFPERSEGFGLTCLHCHASSEKESTFASLNNIKGFPGNPLSFFVDETWRNPPPPESKTLEDISPDHRMLRSRVAIEMATHAQFLRYFANVPIPGSVQRMPAETYDHVVAGPSGAEMFITSNACMSCHSGNAWYGAKYTMILEGGSKNPVNVSPYGEWRWSPNGARRQGSDLLRTAGQRAGVPQGPTRGPAEGREYLLPLPRRDGETSARRRSRLRSGFAEQHPPPARLQARLDLQHRRHGQGRQVWGSGAPRCQRRLLSSHRPRHDPGRPGSASVVPRTPDHRPVHNRERGRNIRAVSGPGDFPASDESLSRRHAEIPRVHQELTSVRKLSHDQPASNGQDAIRPFTRAGDVPRVAEQRVPDRLQSWSQCKVVSGLPHVDELREC